MAQNVIINSVTYQNVPSVQIPKSAGGGNAVFYDTTGATGTASDLMSGKSMYGATGLINGSLSVPTISQDSGTKVLTIS